MPRDRMRVPLESGPKLDLATLIPHGAGVAGTKLCARVRVGGEPHELTLELAVGTGALTLSSGTTFQTIELRPSPRHLGGVQWYALCPETRRRVRVLWKPPGARGFASRHAWRGRVAYKSQFLDPMQRAWRNQAKIKAQLIRGLDPDERDFPPKPSRMRWATYQRLEAAFDAQERAKEAALLNTGICRRLSEMGFNELISS